MTSTTGPHSVNLTCMPKYDDIRYQESTSLFLAFILSFTENFLLPTFVFVCQDVYEAAPSPHSQRADAELRAGSIHQFITSVPCLLFANEPRPPRIIGNDTKNKTVSCPIDSLNNVDIKSSNSPVVFTGFARPWRPIFPQSSRRRILRDSSSALPS
jgi:hypothetical protein